MDELMTLEQFAVAAIMIIAATAGTIWHFMFKPRLDELETDRLLWRTRAETAEDIIRTSDADGMKLVGSHDWGSPLEFLNDTEWGQ